MVSAEEVYENVRQVVGYEGEHAQNAREDRDNLEWGAGVAFSVRYGAMYCTAPTTATKCPLQYEPRARGVPEVPPFANLCIESEIRLFVIDVTDGPETYAGKSKST